MEHKANHRVLIIPEYTDMDEHAAHGEEEHEEEVYADAETDGSEMEGVEALLDMFTPIAEIPQGMHIASADLREQVTSLSASLALEILGIAFCVLFHVDAMCYFQFDIEGMQRVLSKRVPSELIHGYIFKWECARCMRTSMVLRDAESAFEAESHGEQTEENKTPPEEVRYSWDVELGSKEEEVITRETFSPTVLEFMMRDMGVESCDTDVMYCLKEVEPILHSSFQPLLPLEQIPTLLSVTMNSKRMLPMKKKLLSMQSTGGGWIQR